MHNQMNCKCLPKIVQMDNTFQFKKSQYIKLSQVKFPMRFSAILVAFWAGLNLYVTNNSRLHASDTEEAILV